MYLKKNKKYTITCHEDVAHIKFQDADDIFHINHINGFI